MEDDRVATESDASPFFEGSIAEAIGTVKMLKKTLIVYISGENDDCFKMDQTTWKNLKVLKLLRERFVSLHLPERSSDAAHFYALYPCHGVPSISIISSNGMLLKKFEGYAQPEEFLSMLEQSLAVQVLEQSLAVQAAATNVAAVASANTDSTAFTTPSQAMTTSIFSESLNGEGGSSLPMHADIRSSCSPTDEKFANNNDGEIVSKPGISEEETKKTFDTSPQVPFLDEGTSSNSTVPKDLDTQPNEKIINMDSEGGSFSPTHVDNRTFHSPTNKKIVDGNNDERERMNTVSKAESSVVETEQALDSSSCDPLLGEGTSSDAAILRDLNTANEKITGMEALVVHNGKAISSIHEKAPKMRQAVSSMLLIQVRLTNGRCIQKSFNPIDKLAVVKTFVDQNQNDGNDTSSLAVPYPRKVFSQEDLNKSLLELSLEDRATLILVKSSLQSNLPASESSMKEAAIAREVEDSGSTGGIWKIFSYLNPLSYFSGSSDNSKVSDPGSSRWQYEPNPNLQASIRGGTSENYGRSNANVSETDASKKAKSRERSWGGNIHTLQHNDNDEAFKRGNTFWNGNSTQFGGDDSQK